MDPTEQNKFTNAVAMALKDVGVDVLIDDQHAYVQVIVMRTWSGRITKRGTHIHKVYAAIIEGEWLKVGIPLTNGSTMIEQFSLIDPMVFEKLREWLKRYPNSGSICDTDCRIDMSYWYLRQLEYKCSV